MNRKQFLASLVGFAGLGVVANKLEASPVGYYGGSSPTPLDPNTLPKDLRSAETVVRDVFDEELKDVLRIKDHPDHYTRWMRGVHKSNFDKLMTMDFPMMNIEGRDYIIINRYPIYSYN